MHAQEQQFERLIHLYRDKIFRLCYTYTHDGEDVKDLLQDIFLKIWKGLDTFQENSNLSTWIYRISVNSCIDHLRKQKRRRGMSLQYRSEGQNLIDPSKDVEKQFVDSERVRYLYRGIDRLSLLDKTLVSLYLEDLTYKEISEVMGITETNVGVRLHRIKKRLNEYLEGLER